MSPPSPYHGIMVIMIGIGITQHDDSGEGAGGGEALSCMRRGPGTLLPL